MKVIFLDNIKGVGQAGDVKQVSDGYARNFLFPRKLARPATAGAVKDAEALRKKRLAQTELAAQNAQKAAEQLKDVVLEFTAKASGKGTLFEGITAEDVVRELKKAAGVSLAADAVKLPEAIKTVGEHQVDLELPGGVAVSVKAVVKAK